MNLNSKQLKKLKKEVDFEIPEKCSHGRFFCCECRYGKVKKQSTDMPHRDAVTDINNYSIQTKLKFVEELKRGI